MFFNGYIQWEGEKDLKYKFPYEQFNIEKSYSSKVNIILSRNILLEFSFKTSILLNCYCIAILLIFY